MAALTSLATPEGVVLHAPVPQEAAPIFTPEALQFLAALHRNFEPRRQAILRARDERQERFDAGELPGFLPDTQEVRESEWSVGTIPEALSDRRVEITGPVDRKMMINALNSGAKVFMADYEDSNSPTWNNCVNGQRNIYDAVRGNLSFHDAKKEKDYAVGDDPALLVVRTRGWHLDEAHITVDGQPMSASLFDFGLDFWHNAKKRLENGEGPYYYIPKLEHHLEARLWNDVFVHAQQQLGIPTGTIKVTCLVETFPAVFQMDEILWELRDHAAGLNAGRWDYIFSCIKTCRNHSDKVLPDRAQVTMTVPFMRAYTELLVRTCHKRGAFAMGGMSAFIPNRRDPEVTEKALAAVRADKEREADDGCDGTWVAHPDLVSVAMEIFDAKLGDRPNQTHRLREDVDVSEQALQDFRVPDGTVTEVGLRQNIEVALLYLDNWLRGNGAVAIHNLMEDAATAEISRSQIWQWVHHGVPLDNGRQLTADSVPQTVQSIVAELKASVGETATRLDEAAELLATVALADAFPSFLTLPAYHRLIATENTA